MQKLKRKVKILEHQVEVNCSKINTYNELLLNVQFVVVVSSEIEKLCFIYTLNLQIFHAGEKILDCQNFQFPHTWVYVDYLEVELDALNKVMKKMDAALQARIRCPRVRTVTKDKVVRQNIPE